MSLSIDFRGKNVLITGGTMGIGAAIVEDFKHAGANLIVTGAEDIEIINKLNDEAKRNNNNKIKYIRVDFTDKLSFNNFFMELDDYDKIDICINNAGTNKNNPIDEIKLDDYYLLMDVNLHAPFLITRYLSKRMKKANFGRIVNIASIWSVITRSNRAAYSMTKFGIVGLTKTSAVELAPYNVLVNAVSPGFTLTELTKKTLNKEEVKEVSDIIPVKRFAQPSEISKLVLFLASDLNTYITGQNIIIDGGFTNV
ncbi:MAG: SDR family oxidoreductase [Candidatus Cloacimonetes bacterium]|nr:SDR family oxidoreductase [Candidatus Cloacimonadota bacterium]